MFDENNPIELVHPNGTTVYIALPATNGTVAGVLMALDSLGFTIPAAEGKTKVYLTFEEKD